MSSQPPIAPPWVYQQPADLVQGQIAIMGERADTALDKTYATIDALSGISLGVEGTAPPNIAFPNIPGSSIARPDKPSARDFGNVDGFVTPPFDVQADLLSQIDRILAGIPEVGSFVSPIANIAIPAPPGPIDTSGEPLRPDLQDVPIPDDPQYQTPQMEALLAINIPVVPDYDFPDFVDENAAFLGTNVQTVMQWTEPVYQGLVQTELVTTIKAMLAGDFIMPAIVEAMLFDREREREDTTALKTTQEAFDTWAGRGFFMPPGMLVEQVNAVQQGNQLAANERSRDILTKSADWAIANLRQAVGDGIQLEAQLVSMFQQLAQRVFDAARERVTADVAMFQNYVSLYNATQAARQAAVEIFKAKAAVALQRLEAWKIQLEGEQLKGTLNETTAKIYGIRVDALRNVIEIFKARMDGARIRSEINKNLIDRFKAEVEAFATKLTARKVVYDAYDSQMKGVESQARVVEAAARAFAATVEAQTSIGNVKVQAIRGKVEVYSQANSKFQALTEAERTRITGQATAIQARASAFSADCTRYGAELSANTEEVRLAITVAESRLRNNLAYYETRVHEYDTSMTRLIERGRVIVGALSAAGQMSAQLASGAMASTHVQASLSGSGSASTGWNNSFNISENHNFEDESTSHQ